MRTLYLLRHAKPVFPAGTINDFDRPLSPIGRVQAEKLANVLASEILRKAFVVSSSAIRARETIEIVIANLGLSLTAHFESRIYNAELTTLLSVIEQVEDATEILLLVGHNPGMEGLLRHFTGEVHPMPTAGLAKIILETDSWRNSANANARLEWLANQ